MFTNTALSRVIIGLDNGGRLFGTEPLSKPILMIKENHSPSTAVVVQQQRLASENCLWS